MNSSGKQQNFHPKRRYHWHNANAENRQSKRFRGTRGLPNNVSSRWNQRGNPENNRNERPKNTSQKANGPSNSSSNYNNPPNLLGLFDYNHPHTTYTVSDHNQETTAIENERTEKMLATKKRIEEALASRSVDKSGKGIHFENVEDNVETNRDKSSESHLRINNGLELRLTNSDFKEIGSVAPGLEAEAESSDLILNISSHVSQQRSFENSGTNNQSLPPPSKPQRNEGWTMSDANEIVRHQRPPERGNIHRSNSQNSEASSSTGWRRSGDMYIQGFQEEVILGRIEPTSQEVQKRSLPKPPQPRKDFSNVGNLYQSFLKSRLFGYTLKQRNKTGKLTGSNPLLDKSVLENQNSEPVAAQQTSVLEVEMPRPILIKGEDNVMISTETIAEEANEFCKEYSFLLTHPNLLIPPENLEKLGLGHLSEMNDLVSNSDVVVTNTHNNNENIIRVKSLSALNNISQNDTVENQHTIENQNTPKNTSKSPVVTEEAISVNSIADKVVEKLFSSLNKTNTGPQSVLEKPTQGDSTPASTPKTFATQDVLQTISGHILKIFLIDKQIQELSEEKMKIYNELLSIKDVSSTLFNTWAQEQIQKNNSVNVQVNQTNIIAELLRVHELNRSHNNFIQALTSEFKSESMEQTTSTDNHSQQESTNFDHLSNHLSTEPPEVIRPLLTVRKDLHDPNLSSNFEDDPVQEAHCSIPDSNSLADLNDSMGKEQRGQKGDTSFRALMEGRVEESSLLAEPVFVKVEAPFTSPFSLAKITELTPKVPEMVKPEAPPAPVVQKKKSKRKKKQTVTEIIELIDSSDDDNLSVRSEQAVDPLRVEQTVQKQQPIVKKLTRVNSKPMVFQDLDGFNPTCMKILRKAAIIGTREGFLLIYNAMSGKEELRRKMHTEAITCVHVDKKNLVITLSLDCNIHIFDLKKSTIFQLYVVGSPIFSCCSTASEFFVGTKTGNVLVFDKPESEKNRKMKNLRTFSLTECCILALAAGKIDSRDVLIVVSRGEQISVCDVMSGENIRVFNWCDSVCCLQLHQEWAYCATSHSGVVRVVNYATGENAEDCMLRRSICDMVLLYPLTFTAVKDGNIYVHNVQENEPVTFLQACKGHIQSIAVFKQSIIVASNLAVRSLPFPGELLDYIEEKQIDLTKSKR